MRITPITNSGIIFKDKLDKKRKPIGPVQTKAPYFAGHPPINGAFYKEKDSFEKKENSTRAF